MELDLASYKAAVFSDKAVIQPNPETPAPAPETPTVTSVVDPIQNSPETPVVVTPEASVVSAEPVIGRVEEAAAPSQYTTYLKETFGFDSEDALKAAIAAPKNATAAEVPFANDESKRIHTLLRDGKVKEVVEYYNAQEKLANLDAMDTDAKLKLFIQMKVPGLDKELLDEEFNERYSINEDDFVGEPNKLRREKLKMEQKKTDDLNDAVKYFSKYKTKIELPNTSVTPAKDEAYESWKAAQAESEKASQAAAEAYTKLTPKAIESKYRFNDEANKLDFTISYEPDSESFSKTVELLSDVEKLQADYNKQDGSPDLQKFARDIYNGRNIDKIVIEAIKQTVTNTKKWFLENQKNIGGGEQRNYTVPPVTEVDSLRSQIFGNKVS